MRHFRDIAILSFGLAAVVALIHGCCQWAFADGTFMTCPSIRAPLTVGGGSIPRTNILFSIASQASPTAPYVTAALLNDSDVVWTDPVGLTTNDKTPPAAFFASNPGEYKLWASDWSHVTEIMFAQSAARAFLLTLTITNSFPYLTGLTRIDLRQNNTFNDRVDLWELPSTITTINNMFNTCSALITAPPVLSACVDNNEYGNFLRNCSNVTGSTDRITEGLRACSNKVTSLAATLFACNKMPGEMPDFSSQTNNQYLNYLVYGCTLVTGTVPKYVTSSKVTTCDHMAYNCPGLTVLPDEWNYYMPLVTTYNNCFALNSELTGDLSTWTWRTIITDYDSYKSQIRYSTSGGALSTNVKATGFTIRTDDSKWIQADVDNFLVDLDACGSSNGTANCGGTTAGISNASPSVVGYNAKTQLVAKGWTITCN